MSNLIANYKSNIIAEWTNPGIKIFQTSSKYCEDNIILNYTKSFEEDPLITRTIAGTYINSTVTSIRSKAFYSCRQLISVNFPNCTSIYDNGFEYCGSVTTISFPSCVYIGGTAFYGCTKLQEANFPKCTTMGANAFNGCTNLTTAIFPKCLKVSYATFLNCTSLATISFPVCSIVGEDAFFGCKKLTTASFPSCRTISGRAFSNCIRLIKLYLTSTTIATLSNSTAFNSTPIGGYSTTAGTFGSIYVPSSLLASYKAKTNWTYFSSRFVGI